MLFILMDIPKHIEALVIILFKVKISKLRRISVPKDVFRFANSADPDEMPH